MKLHPETTDFIDIHSHNPEREAGVFRILNVFSSDFPEIPEDRPVSIGLHPWHISEEAILEMPEVLKQSMVLPSIFAIGEAGLDSAIKTPMDTQIRVFRSQIEFSIEYNKPLIIHCVKAFPELLKLREEHVKATPWIVHGFNANPAIAYECIKKGIYISLSQRLFRNPEKAKEIITVVPLTMIFAETDDDTMPIRQIYQTISDLYRVELTGIKKNIFENFVRVSKQ